jgi:hypothetical protein
MQLTIDPKRGLRKGELIDQSITCYCDIPFEELELHAAKYGRFGVGLDRAWLSRFGARPVAYVPFMSRYPGGTAGHFLLRDLQALLKGIHEHLYDGPGETSRTVGAELCSKQEVIERLKDTFHTELLAFLKFYDGDLPVDHTDCFYSEREWRKFGPMPLPITLKEIVVPKEYENSLGTRFPQYRDKIRPL